MKIPSIVCSLLVIAQILVCAYSAFAQAGQKSGNFPISAHSINIAAGQELKAILSWKSSAQLEIELFEENSNLLEGPTKMIFAGGDSPQEIYHRQDDSANLIIVVKIISSETESDYSLGISLDGSLVRTEIGKTVSKNDQVQLELKSIPSCTFRLSTTSKNAKILLYEPSYATFAKIGDESYASRISDENGILVAKMYRKGDWLLVVKASSLLFGSLGFKITVQYDMNAPCLTLCGSIQNSIINSTDLKRCYCKNGYLWSEQKMKCLGCSDVAHASLTSKGQCKCDPNYSWNSPQSLCKLSCKNYRYALENKEAFSGCLCREGFLWNQEKLKCEVSCSNVPKSASQWAKDNTCTCVDGFDWNIVLGYCQPNCSYIEYSTGPNRKSLTECICKSGFQWNSETSKCQINCTIAPYASGYGDREYSCSCISGFKWNLEKGRCEIVCGLVPYGLSSTSYGGGTACWCRPGFSWSSRLYTCVANCLEISYTTVKVNSFECGCQEGYTWNTTEGLCAPNCQNVQNSVDYLENGICVCKSQFQWDDQKQLCLPDQKISKNSGSPVIIGAAAGGSVVVVVAIGIFVFCYLKKRKLESTLANSLPSLASNKQLKESNNKESQQTTQKPDIASQ